MSQMTSTTISGNMRVVYPSSWTLLNPEEAETSSHACVLSCPIAATRDFPSEYLYLSDKPCCDFDEAETNRLYGLVDAIWREFPQLRIEEELSLKYAFGSPSLDANDRLDAGLDLFASKHKIAGGLLKRLRERLDTPEEASSQLEAIWRDQTGTNADALDQVILANLGKEARHIILEIPLRGQQPKVGPKAMTAYIEEAAREGGRQG